MSEQKSSFMADLDQWTLEQIISPLSRVVAVHIESTGEDSESAFKAVMRTNEAVKKAVRDKVLESYRNGQAAGPRKSGVTSRLWKK